MSGGLDRGGVTARRVMADRIAAIVHTVAVSPGMTANTIVSRVGGRRGDVLRLLKQLVNSGVLHVEPGGRRSKHFYLGSRASDWYPTGTAAEFGNSA